MSLRVPFTGAHAVTSVFVHVVWSTHARLPHLAAEGDARLIEVLRRSSAAIRVRLLAGGAFDDHVHALVQLAPDVSLASVVQRLKGTSSHVLGRAHFGGWQVGYWAESIGIAALDRAEDYVANQRAHHARVAMPEPWETEVDLRARAPHAPASPSGASSR